MMGCKVEMPLSKAMVVKENQLSLKSTDIDVRLTMDPNLVLVVEAETTNLDVLRGNMFHPELRHLRVIDPNGVVDVIVAAFLKRNKNFETVDLSSLRFVNTIERNFLIGSPSLRFVQLPPLVQNVEGCFLMGCRSLSEVDLTPLY
eukprot:TRINITY_DN2317_c1_g2_i1.p1 TRINITY_DN2317_c1_g2~~TRINITY_DN2317_c1_g2_i1.p1  ORF type:complete len:145 (+),score=32.20 TRINITY_DN2317_c1_g2_i1:189-623(+)